MQGKPKPLDLDHIDGCVNLFEKTTNTDFILKSYWIADFVRVSSKVRIYCGHGDTDKSTSKNLHMEDRTSFFDGTACPILWA